MVPAVAKEALLDQPGGWSLGLHEDWGALCLEAGGCLWQSWLKVAPRLHVPTPRCKHGSAGGSTLHPLNGGLPPRGRRRGSASGFSWHTPRAIAAPPLPGWGWGISVVLDPMSVPH